MMTTRTIHATPQEVEALLAGRLTTLWRPVKPQPPAGACPVYDALDCYEGEGWTFQYPHDCGNGITHNRIFSLPRKGRCPYGQPGDMLVIKEAWHVYVWHDGNPIVVEYRDGTLLEVDDPDEDWCERIIGQSCADLDKAGWFVPADGEFYIPPSEDVNEAKIPTRWRSPVTMPRRAVRHGFTRPITGVQIKRVQSLTEEEAIAAGVHHVAERPPTTARFAYEEFATLWQSRYGTWAENPPAWGITIGGCDAD